MKKFTFVVMPLLLIMTVFLNSCAQSVSYGEGSLTSSANASTGEATYEQAQETLANDNQDMHANKNLEDSLNISPEELAAFRKNEVYTVYSLDFLMKCYVRFDWLERFAEGKTVKELISDTTCEYVSERDTLGNFFVLSNRNGLPYNANFKDVTAYKDPESAFGEVFLMNLLPDVDKFFSWTQATSSLKDVVIYEVYAMYGLLGWSLGCVSPCFLYVVTNHGEYIYYKESDNDNYDDYFLPIEDFYKMSKAIVDEYKRNMPVTEEGFIVYAKNVFDVSDYIVRRPESN